MKNRDLPKPRAPKLTVRQNNFIAEYLKDPTNATEAARRAGYTGSDRTLTAIAAENLTKPIIRERVDEGLKRIAERTQLKAEDFLAELARIAFSDVGGAFDENGKVRPLHKMPADVRRAISSFEVTKDRHGELVTKVRFWNKNHAIETGMKHLGMLVERKQLDVHLTLEQLVLEAMKPVAGSTTRVTVAGSSSEEVLRAADALPESTPTEPE